MKQIVGIMQDPRGHPVRQDANGMPAEVKTGPYLLDDGVSLEAPIPVIVVTDDFYRDSAGNLRGVWPMNITGLASWSPLDLFEDGTYTGRLYDFKQSRMWSDDGVTLATAGQSVQRIEDLTGGSDPMQANSAARGILRSDGIELDGIDDFYPTGWVPPNAFTVLICARPNPALGATACLWGGNSSTNGHTRQASQRVSHTTGGLVSVMSNVTYTHITPDLRGEVFTAGFTRNESVPQLEFFLDGESLSTVSASISAGDKQRYLGAFNNIDVPQLFFAGKIRAFLAINRILTLAEIQQCHASWSA